MRPSSRRTLYTEVLLYFLNALIGFWPWTNRSYHIYMLIFSHFEYFHSLEIFCKEMPVNNRNNVCLQAAARLFVFSSSSGPT